MTICITRTVDIATFTRDIIKPGAAVIDVGINRMPGGKLYGDANFDSANGVDGWITLRRRPEYDAGGEHR